MGEDAAAMPGELAEDGELLGGQMDRLAAAEHRPLEKVDGHVAGLDRLLVRRRLELEQVRDVAFELRGLRTDRREERPVGRTAALEFAHCARNRGEPGADILADRGKERRPQPVALAHRSEFLGLTLEPRAFERKRELVEQIGEERELVIAHGKRAIVAREPDGGGNRAVRVDGVELPLRGLGTGRSAAGGLAGLQSQSGSGKVARGQAIACRDGGDQVRFGKTGRPPRHCNRTGGEAPRTRCSRYPPRCSTRGGDRRNPRSLRCGRRGPRQGATARGFPPRAGWSPARRAKGRPRLRCRRRGRSGRCGRAR